MSGHVELVEQRDPHRIEARVTIPGRGTVDLFIEADVPLRQSSAPWVALATPMAMWSGQPLRVASALDATLAANLDELQGVFTRWWPDTFARVDVVPDAVSEPGASEATGTGSFFSGGVDSFFSVLRRREDLTHLVFVHGFDIPLADVDLADRTITALTEASAALGIPLVTVRTNVRDLTEERLDWGLHFHGAAIATVGHALGHHVSTLLIPSTYSEDDLIQWGSHPELDHLWSSGSLSFVHDGVETTRPQKIAAIAHDQVAMDHLRVCWHNPEGAYNCGTCEKCIRTMLNLYAVGALGRCRTLPGELDVEDVRRIELRHGIDRFAAENIAALRGRPGSGPYIRALRMVVLKRRVTEARAHARRLLRR